VSVVAAGPPLGSAANAASLESRSGFASIGDQQLGGGGSPDAERRAMGYRRLNSHRWPARLHDDLTKLRRLTAEPSLSPDMLATIAPSLEERDAYVALIDVAPDNPACALGIASLFATHDYPSTRHRVASRTAPGRPGPAGPASVDEVLAAGHHVSFVIQLWLVPPKRRLQRCEDDVRSLGELGDMQCHRLEWKRRRTWAAWVRGVPRAYRGVPLWS
jgi:hypothetical protein